MAGSSHRVARGSALVAAWALAFTSVALAEEAANDGTDPTKPVRKAEISFEHLELSNGFTSDVALLAFTQPIGSGRASIKVKVPVSSVDVFGNSSYGLGDVSLTYAAVPVVTPSHGLVVQAELFLNTADRPELGAGKYLFKPTLIYAKFLRDGSIFAPALVQTNSFGGDDSRADVNTTTIDFYYVPRLKNPGLYMTLDPSVTHDWEADTSFAGLAVTMGYRLGGMMGGNGQVFVKPSFTAGADRPVDWGLQVGFQLLNF